MEDKSKEGDGSKVSAISRNPMKRALTTSTAGPFQQLNKKRSFDGLDSSSTSTSSSSLFDEYDSDPESRLGKKTKKATFVLDDQVESIEDSSPSSQKTRNIFQRTQSTPVTLTKRNSDISYDSDDDILNEAKRRGDEDDVQQPKKGTIAEKKVKKDRSKSSLIREHVAPSGQRIQVRLGDITQEDTDAIVNAANSSLAHGGGVAGAISRAGGWEIQRESNKWVQQHGGVDTGQVAVTGPGDLICRWVVHAVGPIWSNGKRGEKKDLASSVWNSLMKANEMKLESISLPAISSGIFGMPKDLVASIMFDTALKFCKSYPKSTLREIRYTNFDKPTVSVFQTEFDQRWVATD